MIIPSSIIFVIIGMRKTEKGFGSPRPLAKTSCFKRHHLSELDSNLMSAYDEVLSLSSRKQSRKIFPSHIEPFDVPSLYNVAFKQLDSTLIPEFLQSFKCGCDNTLAPCQKILELAKAKPEEMKKVYELSKNRRERESLSATYNQELLSNTPSTFPEALTPQL